MKTELFIEMNGKQTDYKTLTDMAKDIWKENDRKVKDLKSIELYYKPDEQKCYYIFNQEEKGSFEIQ